MRFNKDGKFKIMQITDMQEIPNISPDTLKLLEFAVEAEKPDLVVYTGDQIKGYGTSYKSKNIPLEDLVYETISRLLEPVTKRNIPFAVTFGNHDRQVGMSNEEQFKNIYKKLGNCIGDQAAGIDGAGTYNIPIYSSKGDRVVNNLYLFDSGTDAKGGGYEPFSRDIIKWYQKTRDELKNENGYYVPSVVFQHIPMDEYYVLGDTCNDNDVLLEPPSVPNENTGEFDAINECGDVMAVFVGHDHKNCFVGKYKNVDLGFTSSSGFNCYGNRTNRGVRIIELNENNANEYKTYTRTYKDLVGKKIQRPVFDFLSFVAPETVDAAISIILRLLSILIIFIVGIVLSKIPFGKLALVNFVGYTICTVELFVILCRFVIGIILKRGKSNERKNHTIYK